MKAYYDLIFSIVIYRNIEDLYELLGSIRKKIKVKYKIIIVNNFYDEQSKNEIYDIAINNGCDFIESKNDGYGAGNNKAISYALEHYDFKYIIISNPDIVIEQFDEKLLNYGKDVIAPEIITKNRKYQNPMNVLNVSLSTFFIYKGLLKNKKLILYAGLAINKFLREVARGCYKIFDFKFHEIYMAHGSFVLFSKNVIDLMQPMYDEEMFLFAEEGYVAWKLNKYNFKTWYTTKIVLLHKEDGSMKYRNDINEHLRYSNLYLYEKYYSNNNIK